MRFLSLSLVVVRSKCPSYVGATGILVQEFKHIFKIITKEDKLKGKTPSTTQRVAPCPLCLNSPRLSPGHDLHTVVRRASKLYRGEVASSEGRDGLIWPAKHRPARFYSLLRALFTMASGRLWLHYTFHIEKWLFATILILWILYKEPF